MSSYDSGRGVGGEEGLPKPSSESDSDSRGFASLFRRRWPIIAIITFLVTGAVFAITELETRVYEASSTIVLDTSPGQPSTNAPSMPTEQQVGGSPAVAALVIRALHLQISPEALLQNLSVSVPLGSQVLKFTYSSPDPATAQRHAQAFAMAYLELRREQFQNAVSASTRLIQGRLGYLSKRLSDVDARLKNSSRAATSGLQAESVSLTTQIVSLEQKLSDLNTSVTTYSDAALIGAASLPTSPASPKTMLNLTLGAIAGLVLGLGIAAAREYSDDRILGRSDLQFRLRAPVLGPVPIPRIRGHRHSDASLVTLAEPSSSGGEAYRRLAIEFLLAARTANTGSVLVTSGERIDGKVFLTANLAVVLARAGKRVVIVSCDFARPSMEELFDLPAHVGLSDVLQGSVKLRSAVQDTAVENLRLLGHGAPDESAAPPHIASPEDVVAMLRGLAADFILVDAPPMLLVTDALPIAAACDGVLLVSDTTSTTAAGASKTREQLDRLQSTILAGVLVEGAFRTLRLRHPTTSGEPHVPPQPAGLDSPRVVPRPKTKSQLADKPTANTIPAKSPTHPHHSH